MTEITALPVPAPAASLLPTSQGNVLRSVRLATPAVIILPLLTLAAGTGPVTEVKPGLVWPGVLKRRYWRPIRPGSVPSRHAVDR
jgi:hypothetical protein